jgi:hypothetical protein
MMSSDTRLAHAGEDHRQERSQSTTAQDGSPETRTTGSEAAPIPAVTPAPQEGAGLQLVLGLAALSGWLWLPLLRQVTPRQPRHQRAK